MGPDEDSTLPPEDREAVPLRIQGRRVAYIWYSGGTPSGQILFVGTGSYPMLD